MSIDLDQLSLSLGSTSISPKSATPTLCCNVINHSSRYPNSPAGESSSLRAGSPSSTMTVRRNDAFARVSLLADSSPSQQPTQPLRRRSSHLSRWLLELQIQPAPSTGSDVLDQSDADPVGTQSHPYLAYPHMNMAAVRRSLGDADSMHDYVVVDDSIALECPPQTSHNEQSPSHDATESEYIASSRSTIRIHTPQSLRHFHISKHPVSPPPDTITSRSSSRLSMFHRHSRSDLTNTPPRHARSASVQTPPSAGLQMSLGQRSNSWRWRPSVLGHFFSPSASDACLSPGDSPPNQSRPSMSSTNTCSSTTAPTSMYEDGDSPLPSTPASKSPSLFGSLRARSHTGITSSFNSSTSSPALRSLPLASAPHLPEPRTVSFPSKAGTIRSSFASKHRPNLSGALNQIFPEEPNDSQPHVLYGAKGHRLSLSSLGSPTRQTKKKLVVGGIARNDTRRLEAIQKWCQSFGEVEHITRMPNGDLHISFKKAEIADMVCRVRAKVQIAGADSVHLSWISGNKRT